MKETKLLGLYIDDRLPWALRVNCVSRTLSKLAHVLCKIGESLTGESILLIYNTIVHPNLLYGLNICGFNNKVHLSKVFVNQKKLVRMIADVHLREHTSPIF